MTRAHRLAAAVAAATIVASLADGCGTTAAVPYNARGAMPGPMVRVRATPDLAAYGGADTAFGLSVLGAWCRGSPDGNVVMSPVSLATGLGMAYLGARGSTARSMAHVLHLPPVGVAGVAGGGEAGAAMLVGLAARARALRALNRPGVTVTDSDRLWADLPSLPSYRRELAAGYRAGLTREPLLTDPSLAARQIDSAIARATRGHIAHLLDAGELGGIGWLMTDAMYLQAKWADPFDPSATHPASFSTAAGRQVQVQYMNGGRFASVTDKGWTAVALPYKGAQLEMLALLPRAMANAAAGCPDLPASTMAVIADSLRSTHTKVYVDLPKVNLRSSLQLNSLLERLGMGLAFSPEANFTGISQQASAIGLVVHAATMKVAEAGTVASAATAVGITPTDAKLELPVVSFDRPYLLVVLDKSTEEPLFMARVTNPDLP
jgi:serpin B